MVLDALLKTDRKCDPIEPGPENVTATIFVSARGADISIFSIEHACTQVTARTYHVTVIDDETFNLPDDLHPATLAMLNGIALRFMQLARHGFDREP
jgi:hypothetical protein